MKKENRQYLYWATLTAAGILLRVYTKHHYTAGIMTGAGANFLFLLFVGRKVAAAAAKKIDKQIRDNRINP